MVLPRLKLVGNVFLDLIFFIAFFLENYIVMFYNSHSFLIVHEVLIHDGSPNIDELRERHLRCYLIQSNFVMYFELLTQDQESKLFGSCFLVRVSEIAHWLYFFYVNLLQTGII